MRIRIIYCYINDGTDQILTHENISGITWSSAWTRCAGCPGPRRLWDLAGLEKVYVFAGEVDILPAPLDGLGDARGLVILIPRFDGEDLAAGGEDRIEDVVVVHAL